MRFEREKMRFERENIRFNRHYEHREAIQLRRDRLLPPACIEDAVYPRPSTGQALSGCKPVLSFAEGPAEGSGSQ